MALSLPRSTILLFLLIIGVNSGVAASMQKISKEVSFPFFENEFNFPDNSFELDFKNFTGELKISNTLVKGLDTLHIKAELDPKTGMTSSSLLSTSEVGISGSYKLSLSGKTPSGFSLSFAGSGTHSNWIRNLSMGHQALLKDGANGVIQVSDLDFWISFDSLSLSLNNFTINEFSLDWIWKPLNRFLNGSFQELFSEVRIPLVELITRRLNALFQEQDLSYSKLVAILREM